MIDRRRFLQGTLLLGSLPLVPGIAGAAGGTRVLMTAASGCADGRGFAAACGRGVLRAAAHDPGALLAAVERALTPSAPLAVAGLGLESHYFTLSAEATRLGLRQALLARHAYANGGITHTVTGGRAAVALAPTLAAAGARWPTVLAGALPAVRQAGAGQRTVRAPVARPADGPGHLVSWVFTTAAA